MRRLLTLIAACATLLASPPALAHHSFAMYDQTRTVTLKGAIKTFLWTNPHVVIWLVGAPVGGGSPQTWTVELTSPGNLTRIGWTRTSLKPGDDVEMQILPLRDGQPGGAFKSARILATGQELVANWVQQSQTGGHP
ncbi:MAG: hypothetical protein JO303_09420 [Caulobacteraceae bacterium]|nr:hypothetical protein [Caulobacteraceae bacterium]